MAKRTAVITAVAAVLVAGTVAAVVVAVGSDEPEAQPVGIEQALAGFVRDRFEADYIGECPRELPGGEVPRGICSVAFERTAERAVYGVGPPFSEFLGEVSLARDPEGSWAVTDFRPIPPPDAP